MTLFNLSLRLLFMVATGIGVLAATFYVPAMPDIAVGLGASLGEVQASLSLYLLALAFGMPFAGPFSDRVGRRRPFIAGFAFYVLGSLLCAAAWSIWPLYAGRLLQAVGACLTITITRAIVRDLSTGAESARMLALIAMTTAVVPATAPLIGAHVNALFGWRAAFLVLAAVGVGAGFASWRHLTETLPPGLTATRSVLRDMLTVIVDRRFAGCAMLLVGLGGGFYSFIASAPVVLLAHLRVSETVYGLSVAGPPVCFMTGNYIVSRLASRVGMPKLIAVGTAIIALAAAIGLIVNHAMPTSVASYMLPLMLYGFGNGLIVANAYALALSRHGARAATASGFANLMHVGAGGAFGTFLMALLPDQTAAPVYVVICGFAVVGVAGYWLVVRPTLDDTKS